MLDDSYDSFLEEAEHVIQLHAEGHDVTELTEKLKEHALLVDTSTMAHGNIDPIEWSNYIAENIEFAKREREKRAGNFEKTLRKRPRILFLDEKENLKDSTAPESGAPEEAAAPPENANKLLRVFIFISVFCTFSYLYYSQLPPKCPRPIW